MDSHELLSGCPYGDCGILHCKSLAPSIPRVKCDSKHFCVVISLATYSTRGCSYHTLNVNVYLPTDYGTPNLNSAFF